MPLSVARVRHCLQTFDFKTLFTQELGWDKYSANLQVTADGKTFALLAIAEKKGLQVFECPIDSADSFPDYPLRRKIERQVGKSAHEHVVIYTDAAKTTQTWQWVKREHGKPLACREHTFHKTQPGDALIQKLQHLAINLEEEESLTLFEVTSRTKQAFDVDRVTKRFYERFQKEHAAFLAFIKGIKAKGDREWYASLMLNRLMFVYFMQKKSFLDNDPDYLRSRLKKLQQRKGKDKFLTFYRYFLRRFFHEGLGKPDRSPELEELLGSVPFVNGGLFEEHELETANPDIEITDAAFEKLFDFFDAYQWHLDERPLRADNEINPDVLGYIFEKYINQKQMGAYYTKEDITGNIARNTIIPFLFNAAEKKCAIAFRPDGAVWRLLRDDPDRYIYPAVRHGVDMPLPPAVAEGIKDISKGRGWNGPTTPEYGLPTETWREYMARRHRCHELRAKLKAGEIHVINDLITYNLDICQFAEDVIENCEGPELLRAFYKAIESVSVLDLACGSGAFLFAALNILDPLYEACLDRMEAFIEDLDRSGAKHHPEKFADFRKTLEECARHPNHRYFVLKSIIINNLYGVDIMEEAVEICKLRLFLKLVAQVDKVKHLEPLPDIDFNIRPGNTLVGFASLDEVKNTLAGSLGFAQKEVDRIVEEADIVDRAFTKFREMQTLYGMDAKKFAAAKVQLRSRLDKLRAELDRFLASQYGVDPDKPKDFQRWQDSHQPFHWFAEFYGIMSNGGFGVSISNPPYVELNALGDYEPRGFSCENAGNIYALFLERSASLCSRTAKQGFIVPVSSVSTDRYATLQKLLVGRELHYSSFDDRPSRLFDGLEHIRLTIHILGEKVTQPCLSSTRYNKWNAEERETLFQRLTYAPASKVLIEGTLPKLTSEIEEDIVSKLSAQKTSLSSAYSRIGRYRAFYSRKVGYFLQVLDFEPKVFDGRGNKRPPSEFKELRFDTEPEAKLALCALNSNLFYWFVTVFSDCRHVNKREVDAFPIDLVRLATSQYCSQLIKLAKTLMADLEKHSNQRQMRFKHDKLTVQCFFPKRSKAIIDEIDCVLAKHYGFTDEELDFIINYDIKYRMGQDVNDEGDE